MDYRVIHRMCVDCGEEFRIYEDFQKLVEENDLKLPKRCKTCRDRRKNKISNVVCIDCGNIFKLTDNESTFYKERGLQEPKRCNKCRKVKRDSKISAIGE